jgi:hypothetical protein
VFAGKGYNRSNDRHQLLQVIENERERSGNSSEKDFLGIVNGIVLAAKTGEKSAMMLLMPVGDPAFREVVRGKFHRDAISSQHSDSVPPELAGQVRQHSPIDVQLHAEQSARKFFNHSSSNFDAIFLTH